jgi:rare lipoprotein A (peptidoglycan hydrolase)
MISKTRATCASRDFPRYSYLIVTNLDNGKSVRCFVNDYIEHPDRHVDLSSHAFKQIANLKLGLIQVKITGGSDAGTNTNSRSKNKTIVSGLNNSN